MVAVALMLSLRRGMITIGMPVAVIDSDGCGGVHGVGGGGGAVVGLAAVMSG